jgi:hypothetical protein
MSKVQLQGNLSGTGVFTIASPNSNTDRTLTLPDSTGTLLNSASTLIQNGGPAFSARSGLEPLTLNTFTKLVLTIEDFDTASCFNNTGSTVGGIPPYAFLPNVAGYYQFNGYFQFASASTNAQIVFYKNGISTNQPTQTTSTSGTWVNNLIFMNGTTDYLELYGLSGVTQNYFGLFNGVLVRAG